MGYHFFRPYNKCWGLQTIKFIKKCTISSKSRFYQETCKTFLVIKLVVIPTKKIVIIDSSNVSADNNSIHITQRSSLL